MTRIITTHKNTDFDAFASLVAATLIYPEALAAIPQTVNANVRAFMSIHKDIFDYVDRGRSTPGTAQKNNGEVNIFR